MAIYQVIFFILVTTAISAPATQSYPSEQLPTCQELLVPVQASANNTFFPAYPNSTTPTAIYDYIRSLGSAPLKPLANPVAGVFNISVRYCEPTVKVEGRQDSIQLLLHGLGYTKVSSLCELAPLSPVNVPSPIGTA